MLYFFSQVTHTTVQKLSQIYLDLVFGIRKYKNSHEHLNQTQK